MNGGSQAVRLPKGFRFNADRVAIRREGASVILSPIYEDWADYLENAPSAGEDFAAAVAEARSSLLPLESRMLDHEKDAGVRGGSHRWRLDPQHPRGTGTVREVRMVG